MEELKEELLQCRRCGVCRNAVYEAKGFDGICPVWRNTSGFETSFMRGKIQVALALLDGELEKTAEMGESLYQCTLCGNCTQICGAEFHPAHVMETVRTVLSDLPNQSRDHIIASLQETSNPYDEDPSKKREWLSDLGFEVSTTGETLYFVGCTAALRVPRIAKQTAMILNASKTGFAVMENEPCCGSVMMRIGKLDEARANAEQVATAIASTGAKRVVVTCAGCLKTLRNDYPEKFGIVLPEVLHIIEYANQLIGSEDLRIIPLQEDITVTYHDPCHMGRELEIYEEPRNLLRAIPGITLIEMNPNRNAAICCGAGGGLRSFDPALSKKIAADRILSAEETHAEAIVTTCPFCEHNLQSGAELLGSKMQVLDVVDLLMKAIE
ncbi:MAG: (Fe-S)-binding protein [Candidatus Thorarchaeota archaeon]